VKINESVLIHYALEHNLEFVRNPFHASNGFEFRRSDKVIEAVGFLFGVNSVEVYQRKSDRTLDVIHRRFWFLEPLLKPFLGERRVSYKVLQQFPLEHFNEAEAITVLERCFGCASERDEDVE